MKARALVFLGFLLLPFAAFAANDVSLISGAQFSVGGYTLTVANSNAVDSATINANSFDVVLSKNSALKIVSADRRKLSGSPSSSVSETSCSSSESSLTVEGPASGTVTVTITPSTTETCGSGGGGISGGGGGGGSSGGGGGGGSTPPPSPSATPAPGASGTTPAPSVASPSVRALSVSPVFTGKLIRGSSGVDVKRLQQLLNNDPDTRITDTGAGSPGNETTLFGKLTEDALKKFQKKHSIVSEGTPATTGYGALGPSTRAKFAELFGTGVPSPTPTPPTPSGALPVSISGSFTKGLKRGDSNADIALLQRLLNSDPDTRISDTGAGSPGNETTLFGKLTEDALKKFQEKHGIATSKDQGYGTVGPKTRAKLNELSGMTTPAPTPAAVPGTPTPAPQGNTAAEAALAEALAKLKALQEELAKQVQ